VHSQSSDMLAASQAQLNLYAQDLRKLLDAERERTEHPQALAAELEEIAPLADMEEAQHLVDALTHEVDQLRSQLAEIAQQA